MCVAPGDSAPAVSSRSRADVAEAGRAYPIRLARIVRACRHRWTGSAEHHERDRGERSSRQPRTKSPPARCSTRAKGLSEGKRRAAFPRERGGGALWLSIERPRPSPLALSPALSQRTLTAARLTDHRRQRQAGRCGTAYSPQGGRRGKNAFFQRPPPLAFSCSQAKSAKQANALAYKPSQPSTPCPDARPPLPPRALAARPPAETASSSPAGPRPCRPPQLGDPPPTSRSHPRLLAFI